MYIYIYIYTYIYIYIYLYIYRLNLRHDTKLFMAISLKGQHAAVVVCEIPRNETCRFFDFFRTPPLFLFPRGYPRFTPRLIKTSAPDKKNQVDCNF